MKAMIRLLALALMLSGWALAALCLHIVRTPDPADPSHSRLVVIPKARLNIDETYVDARHWTAADVATHADLVSRMLDAGKADQLKFLTDPKSKADVQTQITDMLAGAKGQSPRTDAAERAVNVDISF
jgi:hypothetical protein